MQQARKRHRYAQTLCFGECKADVLVSEWRCERRRLKLTFGDQGSVDLISRRGEDRGSQYINVGAPVDAGLIDSAIASPNASITAACRKLPVSLTRFAVAACGPIRRVLSQCVEQRLAGIDGQGCPRRG